MTNIFDQPGTPAHYCPDYVYDGIFEGRFDDIGIPYVKLTNGKVLIRDLDIGIGAGNAVARIPLPMAPDSVTR